MAAAERDFVLIAHRGSSASAPENTMAAFNLALRQATPNFETDVQLTADSVPVLLHDETMGRTVAGSAAVSDVPWSQLAQLDAGAWFDARNTDGREEGHTSASYSGCRVPLLSQALQRYRSSAHIHLVSMVRVRFVHQDWNVRLVCVCGGGGAMGWVGVGGVHGCRLKPRATGPCCRWTTQAIEAIDMMGLPMRSVLAWAQTCTCTATYT